MYSLFSSDSCLLYTFIQYSFIQYASMYVFTSMYLCIMYIFILCLYFSVYLFMYVCMYVCISKTSALGHSFVDLGFVVFYSFFLLFTMWIFLWRTSAFICSLFLMFCLIFNLLLYLYFFFIVKHVMSFISSKGEV